MPKIGLLNKRQETILSYLEQAGQPMPVSSFLKTMPKGAGAVSRMTVNRDLRFLVEHKYVVASGSGRGAAYAISPGFQAIKPIAIEAYFSADPDKRRIKERFNFEVFSFFGSIFTSREQAQLERWNKAYREHVQKLSGAILKREYERLTVDLSWKSSKIEGNTYTLLETEYLLREHKEPKGHTRAETTMVLNHKTALDYIRAHQGQFKSLSVRKIEEIHSLLIKDLGVERNIRTGLVRVGGTAYHPLDNKFQITEALGKTCQTINKLATPFAKAFSAMLLIPYIQPFEDGNKRASRLIGNALLMAHRACPLSFRSIDELEYKKAMLLFYEQNNFSYFKKLFMEQFEFAVNNYFG